MPPNSGVTTTSLGVSALGSHLCNPRVCIRSVPRKAELRSSPCRSEHSSRLTPDLAKPTHTASIKRRLPRNQNQKTTTTTTPTDGRGPGLRSQKETRQRRMRWSAQSLQCVDRENIPGMNPPPPPLAARWSSRDSRPVIECLSTLSVHATGHHMCLPTWEQGEGTKSVARFHLYAAGSSIRFRLIIGSAQCGAAVRYDSGIQTCRLGSSDVYLSPCTMYSLLSRYQVLPPTKR